MESFVPALNSRGCPAESSGAAGNANLIVRRDRLSLGDSLPEINTK